MSKLNKMIVITEREQAKRRGEMLKAGKIPVRNMTEREIRVERDALRAKHGDAPKDVQTFLRLRELESWLDGL